MTIPNLIARGILATGVACFAAIFVVSGYFVGHRPAHPQHEFGFVFAFTQHSTTVYLTSNEHRLVLALPFLSMILVGVGIAALKANARSDTGKF